MRPEAIVMVKTRGKDYAKMDEIKKNEFGNETTQASWNRSRWNKQNSWKKADQVKIINLFTECLKADQQRMQADQERIIHNQRKMLEKFQEIFNICVNWIFFKTYKVTHVAEA